MEHKRPANLIGLHFGRLAVLRKEVHGTRSLWVCQCDCGREKRTETGPLRSGRIRSCGCLRLEAAHKKGRTGTHGMTGSPEYTVWKAMMARCYDAGNISYPRYGARGVEVCARWRGSFESFYSDMGARPANTSIDRINNSKGYEPGNCRWATPAEQTANRQLKRYAAFGEFDTYAGWARRYGVTAPGLRRRMLVNGMTLEEALTCSSRLGRNQFSRSET